MALNKIDQFISNIVFEIKRVKLVRFIIYPFINLLRLWRKKTFHLSKDGKYIKSLKNRYYGKRCFIIGNGPSLKIQDLEILKNEICFATNRIFTIFDQTNWRPEFYLALDAEIIKENIKEINQLRLNNVFIDIIGKKYRNKNPNLHYFFNYSPFVICIPSLANITYSENLEKFVGMGYTVTYACLQFALYMGFKEIFLLGMDHNFSQVIDEQGIIHKKEGIVDHFNEKKNNPRIFQFLKGVNYAYELANKKAKEQNAHIINISRGGKLEIFQRNDFDSLFDISNRNI